MNITFLGTGSGNPTQRRASSSVALKDPRKNNWFLIDCGDGAFTRLMQAPELTGFKLNKLDGICITHVHGDHLFGLAAFLMGMRDINRSRPLTLIGPRELQAYVNFHFPDPDYFPYAIQCIDASSLQGSPLRIGHYDIDTTPMSHRVATHAYRFKKTLPYLPVLPDKLSKRGIPTMYWGMIARPENKALTVNDVEGQKFTLQCDDYRDAGLTTPRIVVCGDNDDPACLTPFLDHPIDLLVHEATYEKSRANPESIQKWQHCTAHSIAAFVENNSISKLIMTHFSAAYKNTEQHLTEAQSVCTKPVYAAEDKMAFLLKYSHQEKAFMLLDNYQDPALKTKHKDHDFHA